MPPHLRDMVPRNKVMFNPHDRIVRSASSAGESSPGDYLILDLDSGRYYGVGEAGGFIWDRLDGKTELRSIGEAVATHFNIEASRAATDLMEFVTRLHELSLIERIEGS